MSDSGNLALGVGLVVILMVMVGVMVWLAISEEDVATTRQQHPFGAVCPHGVQMLDECEECK